MKLRYISLTGADDKTDISLLENFSEHFPLFECAILMFPERDCLARNPSLMWRKKFYQSSVKNRALHLCGSAIEKFANKDKLLLNEINQFQRVQINLKPQYASVALVEALVKVVKENPHIEFITQHNSVNTQYFPYWNDVQNHSYLFDASLGKGVAPETWPTPVEGKRCGYAGGWNPLNTVDNLNKIAQVAGNKAVWGDMESGVRTNDELDKEKCLIVLQDSHQWAEQNDAFVKS